MFPPIGLEPSREGLGRCPLARVNGFPAKGGSPSRMTLAPPGLADGQGSR